VTGLERKSWTGEKFSRWAAEFEREGDERLAAMCNLLSLVLRVLLADLQDRLEKRLRELDDEK